MTDINQIRGLHHVTSLAGSAPRNNAFFTKTLGLRRVKKTVNFDAPDVYHLYYGDELGRPGGVMTYFPFPDIARGRPGVGEVGETVFSVPEGSLPFWIERLEREGVDGLKSDEAFGERRLHFAGPDGDGFALVEARDGRAAWTKGGIGEDHAIRGFHSASLRLRDDGATAELLKFMGYRQIDKADGARRFAVANGNGADFVDVETLPNIAPARQGAGSVHHIAFAVPDRAAQLEVRKALMDTGYQVTPVIDRDYFWAIYFRTPGGVLFEVATNEPGFDRDEDTAHLGEALKLPKQHAHLREKLEKFLEPIPELKEDDMSLDTYKYATSPGEGALVFAFHGTGGDERQLIGLARDIWPEAEIVAPRGDVSEYGALRFFRRRAEGVYDFDDLARRTQTMAAFVGAHKARAGDRPVIGFGYSNGANILASVAFSAPGLFDDIALMHPLIPWRPADDPRLASMRVLITAGRRDPICPPDQTLALAEFWARQGADVTLEWHDGGHELRDGEVEALRLWSAAHSPA